MLDLVTDRVQEDVDARNDKGTYNATDINRVTAAMDHLNDELTRYGYATSYKRIEIPHKAGSRLPDGYTELEYIWYESDIPTESLMTTYLSNVQAIRSTLEVLSATPETPESMELLTWVEANNIEQILVDVETVITSMSQIFLRAGTSWANSGGPNFYFAN